MQAAQNPVCTGRRPPLPCRLLAAPLHLGFTHCSACMPGKAQLSHTHEFHLIAYDLHPLSTAILRPFSTAASSGGRCQVGVRSAAVQDQTVQLWILAEKVVGNGDKPHRPGFDAAAPAFPAKRPARRRPTPCCKGSLAWVCATEAIYKRPVPDVKARGSLDNRKVVVCQWGERARQCQGHKNCRPKSAVRP